MKFKTKAVATLATSVAIVGIVAGPALADQGASIVGAQAYWKSSTKTLSANDTQADGKSARARLQNSNGKVFTVTASGGKNDVQPLKVTSIPSGSSVKIQACTIDLSAGKKETCGGWVSFKA